MDVDLPQLRALAAVADTGSFEAAAARLHVTPSAISQRIKTLETAAGAVLLRRGKPAGPTSAGEGYLRLARQLDALVAEATHDQDATPPIPLAISADALATWALPALAAVPDGVMLDIRTADQDHTAELLRAGSVAGAITSDARPVRGCSVTRLGVMRYLPMASPAYMAKHLPRGARADDLRIAPYLIFDDKDTLQERYLATRGIAADEPPAHWVPGSGEFATAVRLGLGWGMLPEQQLEPWRSDGSIVELGRGGGIDVTLYWQQWTLPTRGLDAVAAAITAAAREALRAPGRAPSPPAAPTGTAGADASARAALGTLPPRP